jgi:hypothetical protein
MWRGSVFSMWIKTACGRNYDAVNRNRFAPEPALPPDGLTLGGDLAAAESEGLQARHTAPAG